MTFVRRVRDVGIHVMSKFQLSTFSRNDSERVSLKMVGDRRVKDPARAASRASELRLW